MLFSEQQALLATQVDLLKESGSTEGEAEDEGPGVVERVKGFFGFGSEEETSTKEQTPQQPRSVNPTTSPATEALFRGFSQPGAN